MHSTYIDRLLQNCILIDPEDYEDDEHSSDSMWNHYSVNENGELTHLALCGLTNIDLHKLTSIDSLKYLKLQECNIDDVPAGISRLCNLYNLNLADNIINELPEEISSLKNLTTIKMTNNRIRVLPEAFGNLTSLVWCYLDHNKLEFLPETFPKLKRLDRLELSHNKIEYLPSNFGDLESLVELYLSNNKLKNIPASMKFLNIIDEIDLDDNNLNLDLDDLNGMDAIDIINYIINTKNIETSLLNEFKLLVVGDERVGKTSVINRILNKGFDYNCKSTPGVEISNGLNFENYKVNIWDFAGQEITHQTHQFFLSKRSFYFLVIDAQTEDDSYTIYNWLSTIKTYGGQESPIIIIVNKIDLNKGYTFDLDLYKNEFNIKEVLYSSAKDNLLFTQDDRYNTIQFSRLIINNKKYICGLDFKMPSSWMAVKQHIESESYVAKDIIDLKEFEDICINNHINSARDQSSLLSLLNQIGTVVAYVDDERLNIIQIINPTWLTNAVYQIIRSEMIKIDGILDYGKLRDIFLSDESYKPRHFRWLMDLVIQFKLAFEIDSNTILIPSRLSNTQPEYSVDEYNNGFGYRFDYHNFLKRNILSQLIVNLSSFVDQDSPKYWKRGVFLKNKLSKAVVILDEIRNTIDINISGTCLSSIDLRANIVKAIRDINDDKYNVDEMVAIKDGSKTLDYESYDYLEELLQSGYKHHIVRVRDCKTGKLKPQKVNINEILLGFKSNDEGFNYEKLTTSIISSLLLMTESRKIILKEKENHINTRLRDSLINRGYLSNDQSLGGESESEKSEGERDITIRCQAGQSKSIIEGVCLTSCVKSKIENHYQKLVKNYDTNGHKLNYLIVYSKSKKFKSLCENYSKYFMTKGQCFWLDKLSIDSENIKVFETNINKKSTIHILVSFSPHDLSH